MCDGEFHNKISTRGKDIRVQTLSLSPPFLSTNLREKRWKKLVLSGQNYHSCTTRRLDPILRLSKPCYIWPQLPIYGALFASCFVLCVLSLSPRLGSFRFLFSFVEIFLFVTYPHFLYEINLHSSVCLIKGLSFKIYSFLFSHQKYII